MELRYHTQKEYRKLSDAEKEELRELRPPRSKSGGDNRKKSGDSNEIQHNPSDNGNRASRNQIRRYKKVNKRLESRIAALEATIDGDSSSGSGSSSESRQTEGNSGHKALVPPIQRRS